MASSNAVGMAQKLLLFWRKPARRCWWEGVELENVEGLEGKKLKVWIRRVWTLEMVGLAFPFYTRYKDRLADKHIERYWSPLKVLGVLQRIRASICRSAFWVTPTIIQYPALR